jgi:predicted AlkP superfamily phosphohydrolase/phosphomutase
VTDGVTGAARGRLFAFGWDGADWAVIEAAWAGGRLPVLRRIVEGGRHGILRSTVPPMTPQAWTSFVTAADPGEHGIFGFTVGRDYRFLPVFGGARRIPTLFRGLDALGVPTAMVTVPWTFPAEDLRHGACVPGWDDPRETFESTRPRELAAELAADVSRVPRRSSVRLAPARAVLADQAETIALRERIARTVIRRTDPAAFLIVFSETDHASHRLWTGGPPPAGLLDCYEQVDAAMGRMIEEHVRPEDTVLVLSDHGSSPIHTYVNLGPALAAGGFLRPAAGAAPAAGRSVAKRAFDRLPMSAQVAIQKRRRGGEQPAAPMRGPGASAGVDWAATAAFPVGSSLYAVGVCVNARPARPEGPVAEADVDATRAAVAAHLAGLRDPRTGRAVFDWVRSREEVYRGPAVGLAPDLVLGEVDGFRPRPGLREREPFSRVARGGHRAEGIYAIDREADLGPTERIEDLLPKALAATGLPVPERASGGDAAPLEYRPEEIREIEARLRDLGYVE